MAALAAFAMSALMFAEAGLTAPIPCKNPASNHMLIDGSYVSSCIDAGVGNIGNGKNDDFLNAGGRAAGWVDITAAVTGEGWTQGGTSGTWDLGNAFVLFTDVAIGFKFGTGNKPDEWFVYQAIASSGPWLFVNVFRTGGGLSHTTLYGQNATVEVQEPGLLALMVMGLLGLAAARKLNGRSGTGR